MGQRGPHPGTGCGARWALTFGETFCPYPEMEARGVCMLPRLSPPVLMHQRPALPIPPTAGRRCWVGNGQGQLEVLDLEARRFSGAIKGLAGEPKRNSWAVLSSSQWWPVFRSNQGAGRCDFDRGSCGLMFLEQSKG